MANGVWEFNATQETDGDVVIIDSPEVEVRNESDGTLADIFEDQAGGTPLVNPFTAEANGTIKFYASQDELYRIKITKTPLERTLRHQAVETLGARTDLADTSDPAKGDALIGYKRTETGGVARTLHAWLQDQAFNVLDFGATGDGSTDDTTAIQDAVDAASAAGGGVVYLPPGTYALSSEITYASDITIRGAGVGVTIITLTAAADAFRSPFNASGSGTVSNVVIENMELDGNVGTLGFNSPYDPGDIWTAGIRFTNVENGTIRDVFSHDHAGYGVEIKLSQNITVHNCWFNANGDDGLSIADHRKGGVSETRNVSVSQCFSWGHGDLAPTETGSGFEVDDGPQRVTFSQCFAWENKVGFEVHAHENEIGPVSVSYNECFAFDNDLDGFRSKEFTDAASRPADIHYTNCSSKENGQSGFAVSDTIRVLIASCTAVENGRHGFFFDAASGSSIRGCLSETNSQETDDTYSNYRVVDTPGVYISNNRARAGSEANEPQYGLHISGAATQRYIVTDNDFDLGGQTANVLDDGAGAIKSVRGNIGYVTENWGEANETPDANGNFNIAHGLDVAPTFITLQIEGDTAVAADVQSFDATNIQVRIKDTRDNGDISTSVRHVLWHAKA